jgi:hypothetical protein
MSDGALATSCLVLALASVVGALRCLADRLLPSAAIYTVVAISLMGAAARVAVSAV